MHAPNDPQSRTEFWGLVSDSLPDLPFILLGDFNNVETGADSSSRANRMGADEHTAFFQMCGTHNLFDCWALATTKSGPGWTRYESRNGVFSWARLDRVYFSLELFQSDDISLIHHIAFQLSDHLPVSMLLHSTHQLQSSPRSFYFKADVQVLRIPDIKNHLKLVSEEAVANSSLPPLQLFVQAWSKLRQETKDCQYQEEYLRRVWSRERYIHLGETNSPYFLRKFRIRRQKARIPLLITSEGVHLNTDSDILEEVFKHFSMVFSGDSQNFDLQRQSQYLQVFSGKVTSQQNALMEDLPTFREFTDILYSSAKGRAPGTDGFNADALIEVWEFVGPTYVRAMQQCWQEGIFPKGFLEGAITLVPKGGGVNTLSALRPITLLSSLYKLFAKLIAARLAMILPTLISTHQQGFVKGRTVFNNVLTFTLLHETLRRERRTASFLMIDFARAFDSLNHEFLFLGLSSLGFSGCTLAPLLFVLLTSALTIHMETAADNNLLRRIQLRTVSGVLPMITSFADYTAFILSTDCATFHNLLLLLDEFKEVSGCAVNWRKTSHLVLGKYAVPPPWMRDMPFESLSKTQGTRYLGVFIANKSKPGDVFDFVSKKLEKRLLGFANVKFNLETKVIVLRFLLQTILTFSLELVQ
ncbi:hypothetical protein R1sor_003908 [Riccia sorocarpa]|uniref:Reverse transcriptase domain-containing protein n=1 Tax=Riccia sorocarpa TaxID=122646 RepID=A0ABD3H715_9MARC